jgi:hypothetical protein
MTGYFVECCIDSAVRTNQFEDADWQGPNEFGGIRPPEHGFLVIKVHYSRCYFPSRWRWRRSQPDDKPQGVGEQASWNGHLGHPGA